MLNPIDRAVLDFFNQFAQRSRAFDAFVVLIENDNLLKGGFVMALYWWAWFRHGQRKERREHLLFAVLAAVFAIFVARALAGLLPFRQRPVFDPSLNFHIPYGFNSYGLISWSSFPSDHAAVFFCLAVGLCFVSRRIGLIAMAHTFFVITCPRVYLGIHFPTDIIGGGLLGIAIASIAQLSSVRESVTQYPRVWLEKYPAWFYSTMFICSFEIAELYNSVRVLGRATFAAMHHFAKL